MRSLKILLLMAGLCVLWPPVQSMAGIPRGFPRAPASTSVLQSSMIGTVKDESVVDNCGCSFSYPSRGDTYRPGSIFITSYDVQTAWMNIDGQDVKLRLAHTTPVKSLRLGTRYSSKYVATGIRVAIVFTVTRLCIPYGPNCESTGYNATITLIKGGRMQRIKLQGACGCY
jgi:hypothetical protein